MENKLTVSAIPMILVIASIGLFLMAPRDGGSMNLSDVSVHEPIFIEGNKGFTKENGVKSGSGTEEDPYIIEDLIIINGQKKSGLTIKNTTRFFIIQDCQIIGTGDQVNNLTFERSRAITIGICLVNVIFGKIFHCQILHTWNYEIIIERCEHIEVQENEFRSDKGQDSVFITQSDKIDIEYNRLDAIIDPALKEGTPEIQFHKRNGISVGRECFHITIKNNRINNYLENGISVIDGINIIIDGNSITNCGGDLGKHGIEMVGTRGIIKNNLVVDCSSAISVNYCGSEHYKDPAVSIVNNNCSMNDMGISIQSEQSYDRYENCIVVGHNELYRNNGSGIWSRHSGADIFNNSLIENGEGIIIDTWHNEIFNNILYHNRYHGVSIQDSATSKVDNIGYNMVYHNNFIGNGNTSQALDDDLNVPDLVVKGDDINEYFSSQKESQDFTTLILIIGLNGTMGFIGYVGPVPNYWNLDIVTIGNYWSDNILSDMDHDGFTDGNYSIAGKANSVDERPLSKQEDINIEGPRMIPHIMGNPITELVPGENYSYKFDAIDYLVESGSLKWSLKTEADWLTLDDDHVLKGRTVMPGTYTINVSVHDGNESDSITFLLKVKNDFTGENENETSDKNDRFKTPPSDLIIILPNDKCVEGSKITLKGNATDPDPGDRLSFMWEIEGIGVIGFGRFFNYSFPAGTYKVKLIVTDLYGNSISTNRTDHDLLATIDIEHRSNTTKDEGHLLVVLVFILALVIVLQMLFFFRKRTPPPKIGPTGGDSGRSLRERPMKMLSVKDGPLMADSIMSTPPIGAQGRSFEDISTSSMFLNISLDEMKEQILKSGPSSTNEREGLQSSIDRMMEEGRISRNTYRTISIALKGLEEE